MKDKYIIADRIDIAKNYTQCFEIYGYAVSKKEATEICKKHWHEFFKNEPRIYEIEEFKKAILYNYIENYIYINCKFPEIQEIEKLIKKIEEKNNIKYSEEEKNIKIEKIYMDREAKKGYYKYRFIYNYFIGHRSQRSNNIIYKKECSFKDSQYI